MFALERAATSRRAGLWTIIGLLLVPLVVAGGFLWAGWNSSDRLDRVQAAVVNNDDPIKIDGQTVPLGRQLSGGLVSADDDPNFSWVITDDEDAAAGLASGSYAAVVTIPKSFSKNATSYSKDDSDQVHHATIDVQTSQITGLADPVVGQAITAQATKVLNATLTKSYLKNIYIGFNQTGKQFKTLASAAGKLSDGTSQLSDGIAKTATGTGTFANGLGQLDSGAQQLATGLGEYSTGVHQYAKGVGQLADGAGKSATGAKKLAKAGKKISSGADELADGATGLAGGLKTLQNGSKQTQGLGTRSNAKNVAQFAGGMKQYEGFLRALSTAKTPEQVAAVNKQLVCPPQLPAESCPAYYAGLTAGSSAAYGGLQSPDGGKTPGLVDGASGLAKAAGALDQIVSGIRFGPDGESGINAYATGMHQFANGLGQYTGGIGQLATGLGQLATGTDKLATGGKQLATGADQITDGATQLASGTAQSADGAQKLYSGVSKLSDGGAKIADGTDKFATGLDKGKDQVPSFDKTLRNKLSSVVATPVKTPTVTEIFPNQASTTLLTVMALWLGALATFLIIRAVPARVLASMKPSWRLALEGVLPAALIGVVQAGILTGVLSALLKLDASHTGALLGLSMLTAVTFAMINHALVAWFGGAGRFISVVVIVIAAAGAITSALPEAFDTITPFLPTTPALDGLRAIASDGAGAGNAAALVAGWLIIGTVASILAVARRRVISPLVAPLPA
jgi:putative membrane protein